MTLNRILIYLKQSLCHTLMSSSVMKPVWATHHGSTEISTGLDGSKSRADFRRKNFWGQKWMKMQCVKYLVNTAALWYFQINIIIVWRLNRRSSIVYRLHHIQRGLSTICRHYLKPFFLIIFFNFSMQNLFFIHVYNMIYFTGEILGTWALLVIFSEETKI